MYEKEAVLAELEPLFKEAAKKDLWFYHKSGLWMSALELKELHKQNFYIRPASEWTLRPPSEFIQELQEEVYELEYRIHKIKNRIRKGREEYNEGI